MWFKKNIWAILGNILIWGVPLMIVTFYIITGDEVTKRSWEAWVTLALFVILIIYFKAFKKRIAEGRLASKIREDRVKPIWRILELFVYACSMGMVFLAIDMLIRIGESLVYYVGTIGLCGIVGYVFLIIDSALKVPDQVFVLPQGAVIQQAPVPQVQPQPVAKPKSKAKPIKDNKKEKNIKKGKK